MKILQVGFEKEKKYTYILLLSHNDRKIVSEKLLSQKLLLYVFIFFRYYLWVYIEFIVVVVIIMKLRY